MFKNPFSFEGRIRRTEYGISFIIYLVAAVIVNSTGEAAILLAYIPILWFLWAQGAKRCHDRGNSGWFQLIPFYVFWMLFADSNNGNNEYGPNPKGIGDQFETSFIPNQNITQSITIPDICPHCKNPNTKHIRLCEWCGSQII